jgi:hypothetical protein
LVIKDDGTFVTDFLTASSPSVWFDQKETGTYVLSGTTLTVTPGRLTATGATHLPR